MPHGFEYIVRPYQNPDSLGGNVIPATPKGTRERAHLTWGGKGTMPSVRFTGVDFNTQNRKRKDVELKEQDRESDIVRIEQPGRPENYVDVARAKKVRLGLEEKETAPDDLAERQYAASGIDPRLDPYKPAMSSPSGNTTTLTTGKETWNMKNQQ
jgi:hypothetical protein